MFPAKNWWSFSTAGGTSFLEFARLISPSATRVQELPQHADPEWVASRAEDRPCSTPATLPPDSLPSLTTPDHAGDRRISLESESTTAHGTAKTLSGVSSAAAAVAGTSEGRREREKSISARDDGDTESRHGDDRDDGGGGGRGGECVTLAITTCKRLRAFLGTAEGLQARCGRPHYGGALRALDSMSVWYHASQVVYLFVVMLKKHAFA